MRNELTLVLGGTGKTGRRVVDRLKAKGVPVRVGSRDGARFGAPSFDWKDPATWGPVLDGVDAVYVAYYSDTTTPDAAHEVGSFARAAAKAGVSRIVFLSLRNVERATPAEDALKESGVPSWTILRCSWFVQNFSEDFILDGVLADEVVLPVSEDVLEPFTDAEDIADVAVAALTAEGHGGRIYEITGRRALTWPRAVAEIAAATGRDIAYIPVPVQAYADALKQQGLPGELIEILTYLFSTTLDGRNSAPSDGVRQALGREARDFSDYVRDTAATGAWEVRK